MSSPEIMLVKAWMDRMGNVYVCPYSEKRQRWFETNSGDYRAFFQQGMGAEDFIESEVPRWHREDLKKGWIVLFKAETEQVLSWYSINSEEAIAV